MHARGSLKALGLLTLLLGANAASAQDASEVKIVRTDLGQGLYMLEGQGGNIGVSVGSDGVILIDDQFAPLTPKIEASIREVSDAPIRFVLNTHWHFDHTGGNENLGKGGAVIVAHHNVRTRMEAGGLMEAFNRQIPAAAPAALPVVTFGDDLQLHLNGLRLEAYHVPAAHTDGDSFIFWPEANVLHAGDLYFNGFYPVIDWGSGGHIDGMIAASDRLLAMAKDDTTIIPGHGGLSNKRELQAFRDMLAEVSATMNALVAEGKNLDEIKAAKPTAKFDETWGKGFMQPEPWVEMVYQGVKRQQAGSHSHEGAAAHTH
jgi:glyoxylase-like metal-dependent hydrolase (beta-lactamase superfamily II)